MTISEASETPHTHRFTSAYVRLQMKGHRRAGDIASPSLIVYYEYSQNYLTFDMPGIFSCEHTWPKTGLPRNMTLESSSYSNIVYESG